MSASSQIDDLERAYAELRNVFGALVIARHRGADIAGLEPDYARRRIDVGRRLAAFEADAAEAPLIASMRGTVSWFDEYEAVDGLGGDGEPLVEPADVAALRRRTLTAFGEAGAQIRVGDETLHRLAVIDRLATEPDEAVRRSTFEAMGPLWRAVDGDGGQISPYRTLLRASADRWEREGSPILRNAAALGIDPQAVEPMLRDMLGAWRAAVGPDPLEPWDFWYHVDAIERELGAAVPRDRLREINDRHLAGLGADPATLRIEYDIFPRPGRPTAPFAFTISEDVPTRDPAGCWRPTVPWVFATYTQGGLGSLTELLHESGHALHYAAIRERPALFEPLVEDGGFVEGIAELVGWDAHEPAFQRRYLGVEAGLRECALARYGGMMLEVCWTLFELELHRHPERTPNQVWSDITETGLGIRPHPEWSWWAMRAQLIDSPGYLANYVFAALVAAALRDRIREVRGDWLAGGGDPGWYAFVSEHLLRFGAGRPAGEVLDEFLGGPLTAAPLLEDLALATG